jgi:hypothetical protein
MRRRQFPLLALALAGGGVTTTSQAHHGWGSYDAQNPQTLNGTVKAVAFGNPHVHVDLDVAGRTWEVTLAPPFRMQARGAEAQILAVGKPVIAHGYPSRVKPSELRAEWIEVDGSRFQLR